MISSKAEQTVLRVTQAGKDNAIIRAANVVDYVIVCVVLGGAAAVTRYVRMSTPEVFRVGDVLVEERATHKHANGPRKPKHASH